MGLHHLFLSFQGRISRSTFWWSAIVLSICFALVFAMLQGTFGSTSTLVLYPPFFLMGAATSVKRMHDRANSPWWFLALLVPLLGPLWCFIQLAFCKGTDGENQYGRDPLHIDRDYLTVV